MTLGSGLLLFAAGTVAGFINAVAGGGSAVTIPILVEMVGGSVANGTNRVAILIANGVASASYAKGGAVLWRRVWPLIPPAVVGAASGAVIASRLDADAMRRVFGIVLILVAASVALRPARWVEGRQTSLTEPWRSLVFLGIGFYGGFVQAGVGFLLLIGLVLGSGFDLVKGNGAKVVLIASYTIVALPIFLSAGQVDLGLGLFLAAGNSTGALVATRLALREGAIAWMRWVLVVAAVAAALRMIVL